MNEQAQAALKWMKQALDDFAATMPPAVREAFVARGRAAAMQIEVGLTPAAPASETEAATATFVRRRKAPIAPVAEPEPSDA